MTGLTSATLVVGSGVHRKNGKAVKTALLAIYLLTHTQISGLVDVSLDLINLVPSRHEKLASAMAKCITTLINVKLILKIEV